DGGAMIAEAVEHVAEVGVGGRLARCQVERRAEAPCRGLEPAEPGEECPIVVQRVRAPVVREQPLVVRQRFAGTAPGDQRPRELRDGRRVIRAQLERAPQGIDAGLRLTDLDERTAEIAMRLRKSGLERNGPAVTLDRWRECTPCTLGVG